MRPRSRPGTHPAGLLSVLAPAARIPILLAALLAVACGEPPTAGEVELALPVITRPVEPGEVTDTIVATGVLRAEQTADLTVPVAGILHYTGGADGRLPREGDRVRRGEVLATVVSTDEPLDAQRAAAEQRLDAAERELAAQRRLFDEGLVSEVEVEDTVSTVADARVELAAALQREDRTRLASPLDGILLRLARSVDGTPLAGGQRVSPGLVVAEVASLDDLVAEVRVVGSDAVRITPGDPVSLRLLALPERELEGRVIRLSPIVEPGSHVSRVEVQVLDNAEELRPGMFTSAHIVAERRTGVPVVPRQAVVQRDGRPVVFVVEGERATVRPVALGLGDEERVEIRQGIEAGEIVVVRGADALTDGVRVRPTGS